MQNKNKQLINSFSRFCKLNPKLRFWQALMSWSGAHKIHYENELGLFDTFYWEGLTPHLPTRDTLHEEENDN